MSKCIELAENMDERIKVICVSSRGKGKHSFSIPSVIEIHNYINKRNEINLRLISQLFFCNIKNKKTLTFFFLGAGTGVSRLFSKSFSLGETLSSTRLLRVG